MKPLTLREVADCLSLHESTVSRAIKGKTMQTPYGLFEMKLFSQQKPRLQEMEMHLTMQSKRILKT